MAELGGMIFGGGLVLFASFAAAARNLSRADEPSPEAAMNKYNASHDIATKDTTRNDYLILSPKFTDSYASLKMALLRHGIILRAYEGEQFATIDLTSLIKDRPSFASERLLNAALLTAGILMSPGEAHGFKEPGYFRITCPHITPSQIDELCTRLSGVMRTFKLLDGSLLAKRSADNGIAAASKHKSKVKKSSNSSSSSSSNGSNGAPVDASPAKKRKTKSSD